MLDMELSNTDITCMLTIERPRLEKELSAIVLPKPELKLIEKKFGIIFALPGTGKTAIIRQDLVCTSTLHPQGVLYHEVFNPHQFPTELGKSAGMILDSHTFFDLAIGYISASYRQYHLIPEDLRDGVSYVLNAVAEQAGKFEAKHGYTPVLVMDSVDLIAKSNRDLIFLLLLIEQSIL